MITFCFEAHDPRAGVWKWTWLFVLMNRKLAVKINQYVYSIELVFYKAIQKIILKFFNGLNYLCSFQKQDQNIRILEALTLDP